MAPIDPPTPGGVSPDPDELGTAAKNVAKRTVQQAKALGLNTIEAAKVGSHAGGITQGIIDTVSSVISWGIKNSGPLLDTFLAIITKVRTQNPEVFNDISAAVLSEFLGVEIDPGSVRTGKGVDASLAVARNIGQKLLARLEQEFTLGGTPEPGSGATAGVNGSTGAATFAGYGVNFAVQNAVISILIDTLTDHHLEQFRELGVETAQNLGLGRLVRQALLPLVRNTIAEPYDRALRKKFRQDHLSEKQLVTALHRGAMSLSQVQDLLAQKGYPDPQITELLEQLTSHLTDAELSLLIRWGVATIDEALKQLQNEGWPAEQAQRKLDAIDKAKVEGIIGPYVNWLETRAISGEISLQAFQLLIDRLPLSPLQKEWENRVVGAQRETPRTKLTLAEMRTAYFTGLITLDEWDAFLDRQGYSGADATVLTYQLLHDAIFATERERRKAVLLKKGVDHLLSFSQVEAAFKAELWTEDRVKQWLDEEGFGAKDAADLLILIKSKAAGAAGRAALPTLRAGQAAPESGSGAEGA